LKIYKSLLLDKYEILVQDFKQHNPQWIQIEYAILDCAFHNISFHFGHIWFHI
jgi:hypothetical protein